MCYSKANGGYRCMPSQALLSAIRGTGIDRYLPKAANGAFWLSKEKPLELWELQVVADDIHTGLDGFVLGATDFEREVAHLGNMIAQYSDAKVEDFDVRLKEAQNLFFDYEVAFNDPTVSNRELARITRRATDANLALGYEVRSRLRETMAEILPFGEPITIDINGDTEHSSMLYSASKFFPNAWTQTLSSTINLGFDAESDSWYDPSINEIRITSGYENFSSYPSMEAATNASRENKRKYETQIEMVHELSHKFESIESHIGKACRSFLERRALPNQGYNFDDEDGGDVRDHFADPYIGHHYGSKVHTEIFSMGMETTFLGTGGSLIGLALPLSERDDHVSIFRADIEHRNLTIGILAGIRPSFNFDTMGKPVQSIFGAYDPNELILGKPVRR